MSKRQCWLPLPATPIFVLPWCISTCWKWCENFKQTVLHLKEHWKVKFSVAWVVLPKFNSFWGFLWQYLVANICLENTTFVLLNVCCVVCLNTAAALVGQPKDSADI